MHVELVSYSHWYLQCYKVSSHHLSYAYPSTCSPPTPCPGSLTYSTSYRYHFVRVYRRLVYELVVVLVEVVVVVYGVSVLVVVIGPSFLNTSFRDACWFDGVCSPGRDILPSRPSWPLDTVRSGIAIPESGRCCGMPCLVGVWGSTTWLLR